MLGLVTTTYVVRL